MGTREETRAETTRRILAAARAEIAVRGGVGLSMRAIAREVGLVSSAVYRYYPTRESLLTAMIVESYQNLARALVPAVGAAESGDAAAYSQAARWRSLATRFRAWGRGHPHEFQLIYGTPIPAYQAPPETIPAAAEVAAPFLVCASAGRVPGFESGVTDDLRTLAAEFGLPPSAAAAVVAELAALVGFVTLELAGHFTGVADPADRLFTAMVDRQVGTLGLGE